MENRHSVLRRGLMPKRLSVAVFTALYVAGSGLSHSSEPHGSDSALPLSFGGLSVGHEWAGINHQASEEAVVILGAPSSNDAEPGVAELGIEDEQLQIRFREWDYLDGKHAEEQIDWLMAKPGTYRGDDGSIVEVGIIKTPVHKSINRKHKWDKYTFTNAFPGRPHIFLTPQGSHGDEAIVVRAKRVKSKSFSVAVFEQEANGKGRGREERVGYVAIWSPKGKGEIDLGYGSVPYEIKKQAIGKKELEVDAFGRQLKLEEEQSKDEETRHTRVTASVMLIGGQHLFAQDISGRGGNTFAFRYGMNELNLTGLKVVNSRSDSVDLAWRPASGKEAEKVIKYQVLRDDVPVSTTAKTHYTDAGLAPDTAYQYKINGLDAEGAVIVRSALVKATTAKAEETPVDLGAPQSLQAAADGSDKVNLSWQPPAKGQAAGYKLYRDGRLIATTVDPAYRDSGLAAATLHRYYVTAIDDKGNSSAASNTASATTAGAVDTTPPSQPSSFRVSKAEAAQISMTWGASSDDMGVEGYEIWRDGVRLAQVTTRAYLDRQVDPLTLYVYKVRAYDKAGNFSGFTTLSVATPPLPDTQAPTVPASLKAEADTQAKVVRLSWNASTDNVFVTGYEVMRDGKLFTATSSNGYVDHAVELGKSYKYQVRAFDAAGNKSASSSSATAELKVIVPPKSGAELAQNCVSCHGSQGVSSDPTVPTLAGMDKGYFEQVMANFRSGKRYGEKMKPIAAAYTADEVSRMAAYYNILSFKPAKQSVNLAKAGQGAKLHKDNCNGCHSNDGQAMNNGTLAGQWKPYMLTTLNNFASGKSSDAPAFMINKIKGMSGAEREALAEFYASHGSDTQAPASPADLAVATKTETSVTLTWTDADDNASIKHYEIERNGSKVGTADQNTFTDTGLTANTTYNYSVYSVDAAGNRSLTAASLAVKTAGEPTISDPSVSNGKNLWDANTCSSCHKSAKAFPQFTNAAVLENAIATNKGGMSLFSKLSNQDIVDLAAYAQSEQSGGGGTGGGSQMLEGVTLLSNEQTLRKALILLAGRLPTDEEYQQAKDEEGLRKAIRDAMTGPNFDSFVMETAGMHFMTAGLKGSDLIFRKHWLPYAQNHEDFPAGEPNLLLHYIATNDRPYTEIVTADYTVLTPTLAELIYGAELLEPYQEFGHKHPRKGYAKSAPARIPAIMAKEGRFSKGNTRALAKPYPHAGVLTMPAWLNKFPTTDSNRNRHRAKIVYRQFLGTEIEGLADRDVDDSLIHTYKAPLLEAPPCMVCHTVMDPTAGAFQNWFTSKMNYQLDGYMDPTYVDGSQFGVNYEGKPWYQEGDRWYRDALPPGFEGKKMPGGVRGFNRPDKDGVIEHEGNNNGAGDALQWLAKELVKDPRFATGAVKFWYKGLFGRDHLTVPAGPEVPNYAGKLKQFQAQNAIFEQLGERFRNNGHIVRDLLVDMVMSDLFRATATTGQVDEGDLSALGMGRMLSQQQLQRKVKATVGRALFDNLTIEDGQMYGGFDGGNLSASINQELSPITYSLVEKRIMGEVCKGEVAKDLARGGGDLKTRIQGLYWRLLGERVDLDSEEIDRAMRLHDAVYNSPGDHVSRCDARGTNSGLRAWAAVVAYLMTDIKYFTE
ncbi:MAG: fibronectin type III domain-containing protein [Candidatus Sedimenticola sp. 20ELBAFRAG]